MKSLMIKDLEISKELTRDDLSAVRGGSANVVQGGVAALTGGFNFGSPTTIVNAPTGTAIDFHPETETNVKVASVFGSALTGVFQL